MATKKGASSSTGKAAAGAARTASKKSTAKATPSASNQHTRVYAAAMSSLKALELTCEKDEADLTAKILSLQLATNDGDKVTAGMYEDDDETELCNLAFEEYQTDADEQSLTAAHQSRGDTFLFKGEAYVKNGPVKVLVFREK